MLRRALVLVAANHMARTRTSIFDPIPKPPSVNEPRYEKFGPEWLRNLSYPRATLSSFAYNFAAIALFWPTASTPEKDDGVRAETGAVAPYVCAALLHTMGFLSLVNWSLRTEWTRLGDVTCMLVLKVFFIAIAIGLATSDTAITDSHKQTSETNMHSTSNDLPSRWRNRISKLPQPRGTWTQRRRWRTVRHGPAPSLNSSKAYLTALP